MKPDVPQFEEYWRQKISDELYEEHKHALREGLDWRAVWFAIASGFVLRDFTPKDRQVPILNSDYHVEVPGRPE